MTQGSVIIPALDEELSIGATIESVRPLGAEVIVVDGGSADSTVAVAIDAGARIITSERGRGIQLAAGARAASGEWMLFLHADSRLGREAHPVLAAALADPTFRIGTFRLRLDGAHPAYSLYSWFTRFDSVWTSFGDQGILIRSDFYHSIGGFPAWTLLEDVSLLRRARHTARIRSLPAEVRTSARRFERNGIIRQQLRNCSILVRYLCGADPESLARLYAAHEPAISQPPNLPATAATRASADTPWHMY